MRRQSLCQILVAATVVTGCSAMKSPKLPGIASTPPAAVPVVGVGHQIPGHAWMPDVRSSYASAPKIVPSALSPIRTLLREEKTCKSSDGRSIVTQYYLVGASLPNAKQKLEPTLKAKGWTLHTPPDPIYNADVWISPDKQTRAGIAWIKQGDLDAPVEIFAVQFHKYDFTNGMWDAKSDVDPTVMNFAVQDYKP